MNRASTEHVVRDWRYGQTQSERLCAALLHLEGYENVNPQAPLGGPDGRKDVLVNRGHKVWIAASYFPSTGKTFSEVRTKFLHDLDGVESNDAHGIVFFVNQQLTLEERAELISLSARAAEIYHLERIRALLDSPKGYGVRLEYCRIAMTEEEQIAFWSAMNYDVTRQLLQNERILTTLDAKLDRIEEHIKRTFNVVLDLSQQRSSIAQVPTVDEIETPSSHASLAMICWIHRIVTEDTNLPEAVRGRLRSVEVWIGEKGSTPATATFQPCPAGDVPAEITLLLNSWRSQHLELRSKSKEEIVFALADFHWRFLRIHPFLDANGRVARVMLDQAARELLNLRIGRELIADSNAYFRALAAADEGNMGELYQLILASLQ